MVQVPEESNERDGRTEWDIFGRFPRDTERSGYLIDFVEIIRVDEFSALVIVNVPDREGEIFGEVLCSRLL